jgi:hypothetical protein
MRIRNKLLAAMLMAVALLVAQIAAVTFFVRQLQEAVTFIGSAQTAIETDFVAAETVDALRIGIKELPSSYVSEPDPAEAGKLSRAWDELAARIRSIAESSAAREMDPGLLAELQQSFALADDEWRQTVELTARQPDLDQY